MILYLLKMYLKEALFISFLALFILIFNLGVKYYYIYKRGYRISNLVIVKLLIRSVSIFCLTSILVLGLYSQNKPQNFDSKNTIFVLSNDLLNGKNYIGLAEISKITEAMKSVSQSRIGLVIYHARQHLYYQIIPTTSKSTFLNLIESPKFSIDLNKRLPLRFLNDSKNKRIAISGTHILKNEFELSYTKDNGENINFINKIQDIPFIKVYLLILVIILLSAELVTKLKIVKI